MLGKPKRHFDHLKMVLAGDKSIFDYQLYESLRYNSVYIFKYTNSLKPTFITLGEEVRYLFPQSL